MASNATGSETNGTDAAVEAIFDDLDLFGPRSDLLRSLLFKIALWRVGEEKGDGGEWHGRKQFQRDVVGLALCWRNL